MIENICIHCDNASKYKCPTCRVPYCSVDCFKRHKEVPCTAPPPAPMPPDMKPQLHYEYPTEDTVPVEKFLLLAQSKELQNCLVNPHLRVMLETLDKSPDPDSLIQEYMQEPIFTEYVDECLKVVEPQENS